MAAKRTRKRVTGAIRVRMYNVGFGDSFLISYPEGAVERRILVDCGTIAAATGHDIESVVSDIVADATDSDGRKRIDVVIATHRHRDHVEGFKSKRWSEVEVGEVWMPWTEDTEDPVATRIRNRQGLVTETLLKSLAMDKRAGAESEAAHDMAMNALRNEAAMRTLHEGFRGSPQRLFLAAGTNGEPTQVDSRALSRVKAHVLGPSRDEAIIRTMDPPKAESYLRLGLAGRGANGSGESLQPFRHVWRVSAKASYANGELSEADIEAIRALGNDSDEAMAATIDSAVNGTSLMLVLEIGKAKLLLPGDAQWGTWKMALGSPASRKLMEAATFLKVGHHGSHNATPKELIEKCLRPGTLALVSVKKVKRWPSIPRLPLLKRLGEKKIPFARSDETGAPHRAFRRNRSKWVDAAVAF